MPLNHLNQPIGEPIVDFTRGELPNIHLIEGLYCCLQRLCADRHFKDIYKFIGPDSPESQWTYLPISAQPNEQAAQQLLQEWANSADPYYLAIIDKASQKVVGIFSLMRIDPQNRTIEMGWVIYSNLLKHSRVATEAQYLAMQYVFDKLKYRRYEWKCDSLNQASFNAAKRLGFQFEGIFRRAAVYKERNRDTAWLSMLKEEWQRMKPKFERWLAADNFDDEGKQLRSLNDC
ncbi:GNAT family N-acetyltransferase [Avibacterium sp. 21-599]|uniref:GNAT family N-acetyltransferase n=1 Tax=Avibacterium sp. 21-599 TaxID=2911528 RepID=UPI00224667B3|nr:GNAT family protein [Avibacterium sp. 21-599]MCW9716923.1 GNAT family N-acetyltransferase [Avibacterium sp. 21-599]